MEIKLRLGRNAWIQQLDYELVSFRCKAYHDYGHLIKDCPKLAKKETQQTSNSAKDHPPQKEYEEGFRTIIRSGAKINTQTRGSNQYKVGHTNLHKDWRVLSNKYEILKLENPIEGEKHQVQSQPLTKTNSKTQALHSIVGGTPTINKNRWPQ